MNHHDHHHDHHDPTPPQRDSTALPTAPVAPWVLLDRTSAEQITDLLEQWLAGGDPDAAAACARACSAGESDAFAVAGWVGCLAARLSDRIEEADSWS
jgi:hypothetical protein